MNTNTIYYGDCLSVMKEIESGSIDFAITSPPYNMNLRIRNGKHCSRQIVKELSTKYKNYPDNLSVEEYYQFNKAVITELLRICGTVFYNVQFLSGNKEALYRLIGDFSKNIKEFVVWDKVNAQPAIGKGILNSRWEAILILQSEEKALSRQFDSPIFERGKLQNLWRIKRGKKVSKTCGAVFPEELIEFIVKNFVGSGKTVLDPFCGTGTTGLVCMKTGNPYFLIDSDMECCEISQKRILEASTTKTQRIDIVVLPHDNPETNNIGCRMFENKRKHEEFVGHHYTYGNLLGHL